MQHPKSTLDANGVTWDPTAPETCRPQRRLTLVEELLSDPQLAYDLLRVWRWRFMGLLLAKSGRSGSYQRTGSVSRVYVIAMMDRVSFHVMKVEFDS